jgi:DNA primase
MEYIDLEFQYYDSLKDLPKTDMEWLAVFPESEAIVKKILKEKLKLALKQEHQAYKDLQDSKNRTNSALPHERDALQWYTDRIQEQINRLEMKIKKFKWQIDKLDGKERPASTGITEQDKEMARAVPIINLTQHKRAGSNYIAICIFHNDSKPSLTIFRNNRFKCFACGAHGDSIDFIKKLNGMEFLDAVRYLLNK